MMDKKTIIGLVLIFLVFIGFNLWMAPSQEEKDTYLRKQDSLRVVQAEQYEREVELRFRKQQAQQDSLDKMRLLKDENISDSLREMLLSEQYAVLGDFSHAGIGEDRDIEVSNDLLTLNISNLGGRVSEVRLKDYRTYAQDSVVLFTKEGSALGFNLSVGNKIVSTSNLFFQPYLNGKPYSNDDPLTVEGDDSLVFSMRAYPNSSMGNNVTDPAYLEFLYTIYGNEYRIGYSVVFHKLNRTLTDNNFLELFWNLDLRQQEKSATVEATNSSIYYRSGKDVEYLAENGKDDKESINNIHLHWIGYKQQFFSSVLLANNQPFLGADMETQTKLESSLPYYLRTMISTISVPYDAGKEENRFDMSFYFGPNKYHIFTDINQGLEKMIPLGWGFFPLQWINRFAVIPVFDFLDQFNMSYGLIILILTLLVKMVLFPLTYKSYASTARMRVLQPEVAKLNEKFPKKEQAMQKQQATMALYKRAGVNPLSGCLPVLVQFPFLVAMFRFFPSSIELRQASFLWADDLSTYDSILDLPFNIPFYGSHVSLFCLLMTVAQMFYTRMTQKQQVGGANMPAMKTMMYIMPIMMLFFLNSFSAALNYYYCLSLCITFIQTWAIRKTVDEDKVRARLLANAAKPVTKSKWQQRMENLEKKNKEIQRQRMNKK